MKLKILVLSFFFLLPSVIYCQDNNLQRLQGSWMGRITTSEFSLRVLLRFEVKGENIRGTLDSPDHIKGYSD